MRIEDMTLDEWSRIDVRAWVEQEKFAARGRLMAAVKNGQVTKTIHCVQCDWGYPIQGHHHDYTQPLDVIWLCPKCHMRLHFNPDKKKIETILLKKQASILKREIAARERWG